MNTNKILLLHGPILSNGINFLSSEIYRTPQDRKKVRNDFDCRENIRLLSILFKKYGFLIIYSGWQEDEKWLESNAHIFDGYCISNQNLYKDESEFLGKRIQNNKEKLIASCFAGINFAINKFGNNSIVVRMRSDMAVDIKKINEEIMKIIDLPKALLIEFADPENIFYVPDSIFISFIEPQLQIYQHLSDIYKTKGGGYHLSIHIDLGATFLKLKNEKKLGELICMSQSFYDTMIWRGIPRYYQKAYISKLENYWFDCIINYPAGYTLNDLIKMIPAELAAGDSSY
jgi:hypothetical protein